MAGAFTCPQPNISCGSEKTAAKNGVAQQKRFKKNPFAFGVKNASKGAEPSFSEKEAITYFSNACRDMSRSTCYSPLPEMTKPDLPTHFFSEKYPTKED